jgi:hypothetical protein
MGRAPAVALNGASARTFLDPSYAEDCLSSTFERCRHAISLGLCDDGYHSNPAVEGSHHLLRLDVAALLEELKQFGHMPGTKIYNGMGAFGKNPRNILEKPAAGNMRKPLHAAGLNER